MKRTYKKYTFDTKQQAVDLIEAIYDQYATEETPPFELKRNYTIGGHTIVYLDRLVQIDAIYDEEGEVVQEAVLYDNYSVDVAWLPKKDEVEYDEEGVEVSRVVAVQDWEAWAEHELEVDNPKHQFV
jgi:hypothetical protein